MARKPTKKMPAKRAAVKKPATKAVTPKLRKSVKDKTATLPKATTFETPRTDAWRATARKLAAQKAAESAEVEAENKRFNAEMDAYAQIEESRPAQILPLAAFRPRAHIPPYWLEVVAGFVVIVVVFLFAYALLST